MRPATNGISGAPDSIAASPPRFVGDEDFNRDIVAGLRRAQLAVDILTASEAGTLRWPDGDVLAWAAVHNRILLSHDQRTVPDHFARFLSQLASGEHSPGVMLLPRTLAIGRSIAAILEIWTLSTHGEWRDVLTRLPL